jgi:hypothetical protein
VEEPVEKTIIKDSVFHAVNDYFSGRKMKFDVDVEFQKKVPNFNNKFGKNY